MSDNPEQGGNARVSWQDGRIVTIEGADPKAFAQARVESVYVSARGRGKRRRDERKQRAGDSSGGGEPEGLGWKPNVAGGERAIDPDVGFQ